MKELLGNGLDTIVSQALQEMKEEQVNCTAASVVSKSVSPPHYNLRMFNLSSCVEPTSCETQKHRLLYTINYGIVQPMMKSGILFCAYGTSQHTCNPRYCIGLPAGKRLPGTGRRHRPVSIPGRLLQRR